VKPKEEVFLPAVAYLPAVSANVIGKCIDL
jgi:hypothetical protein